MAIVMANYNHARYLDESLGGIRSQTRPADEIILIDDGSSDNSVEIIERFAASLPSVRFLRNPQRLGVHACVSRALPLVESDYLVWTAADDCLLPHFLEKSMAALERHPEAGLCFSETTQLLADSRVTVPFAKEPSVKHIFDLGDLPEYLPPRDLIRRMKREYLPIAANTVVVRRDALLSLNGYPRELEWHADSFAYSVIALRHGACVVADTLALIRTTPGSYSQSMYDRTKGSTVLARMLDLLATREYRDIRRIFRACPSNFSPGLGLMLRVQLRKVRDWDLFVTYFLWKVHEYKRGYGLTWFGMFIHLLYRFPVIRGIRAQVQTARHQLRALRDQCEHLTREVNRLRGRLVQLEAERDGFANVLQTLRHDYETIKATAEQCKRALDGAATKPVSIDDRPLPVENLMASMVEEMAECDSVYAPSQFWRHYNDVNLKQFAQGGLNNFKLTANQNYHNFTPLSLFDSKIRRLIRLWKNSPSLKPLLFSIEKGYAWLSDESALRAQQAVLGFSNERMFAYQVFVSLVWLYSRSIDLFKVLDRLEEPELGNPIRVRFGKRLVSQDLATSSREFNAIMRVIHGEHSEHPKLTIGELGAGYGRLAHVFTEMTLCRYLVFDIPPALAVSQWYLSSLFPNKRIFHFRRFRTFSEIAEELSNAEIAFFTPNQLAYFPDRYFDVFSSISSLHEMRFQQIDHYLTQLARLTSSFIYLKQYYRYVNPFDDIVVERSAYRLPSEWQTIFEKTEDIYSDFFELMMKRVG